MRRQNCVRKQSCGSAINVFGAPQVEQQDGDLFVLDVADKTVVSNAVTPQATLLPLQSSSPLSRIVSKGQALTKKVQYGFLCCMVELRNLPCSSAGDLNPPSQDDAPALRA